MDYAELKNRYQTFFYHGFRVAEDPEQIRITYDFEITGLSRFAPEFTLPKPAGAGTFANQKVFRKAAFSLGMVELISYWKLCCPPDVVIECGSLDEAQIQFWKKLYYHGLGEYFWKNRIDADPQLFMNLQSAGVSIGGDYSDPVFRGCLIPVGGGKDSLVTLEILKGMKADSHAFIINDIKSAMASAEAAGYSPAETVHVHRTLDPRMLELNRQGYLNGHTPFSALCAFAALLSAVVWQKKYICLSNEASANEPTIKGRDINHQYSKTFEFETDFEAYKNSYITGNIHYFSLLRPLSELQIAGIFAKLPQYHSVFRSCNVGQKEGRWCGHCAKCLFVAVLLSAYLDDADLVRIFSADMLNDETMKRLFEELTGLLDNKPFECVGTREEVNTAVCMSIRRHAQKQQPLPLLYDYYRSTPYYAYYKDQSVRASDWNSSNQLPPEFEALVHQALKEAFA